jgi:hypothetical protein
VRRNLRANEYTVPSSPIATISTQTVSPPNIPLTPPQTEMNSQFTSPASFASCASSKADHFTNKFALDFLESTLVSINDDIEAMAWYGDQCQFLTRSSPFRRCH